MARGWESKAIEAQQEEKARGEAPAPRWTPEGAQRGERRRALEMTRARILHDRERATADAHRRMLDEALAAIDGQLAAVDERA